MIIFAIIRVFHITQKLVYRKPFVIINLQAVH
jgi:hypothetical protein